MKADVSAETCLLIFEIVVIHFKLKNVNRKKKLAVNIAYKPHDKTQKILTTDLETFTFVTNCFFIRLNLEIL